MKMKELKGKKNDKLRIIEECLAYNKEISSLAIIKIK